jgi:hypothetical protein
MLVRSHLAIKMDQFSYNLNHFHPQIVNKIEKDITMKDSSPDRNAALKSQCNSPTSRFFRD